MLALSAHSTAVFIAVRAHGAWKEVECPSFYARYPHRGEFMELVELIRETLKEKKAYRKAVQAG